MYMSSSLPPARLTCSTPLVPLPVQQRLPLGKVMLVFVCMTNILLITSLISLLSNSLTKVRFESHHILSRAYVHLPVKDWLWSALRVRLCMSFCIKKSRVPTRSRKLIQLCNLGFGSCRGRIPFPVSRSDCHVRRCSESANQCVSRYSVFVLEVSCAIMVEQSA